MKLIGHMNAIAAARAVPEEYLPEKGALPEDQINLLRNAYSFNTFPTMTVGSQAPTTLNFAGGRFVSGENSFAIAQLVMTQEADIVLTMTTEQASLVLDDVARLLDENLGYRLRAADRQISYVSNIVVQFDNGLEQYIDKLSKIASVINRNRPGMRPFNIKRLAFGASADAPVIDMLATIVGSDFMIERRVGQPFEKNWYFCSAPMSTGDHLRVLEDIEATVRG